MRKMAPLLLLGILISTIFFVAPLRGDDRTRDGDFALALLRWGYVDLAVECANHILKGKDFVGDGFASRDSLTKGAAFYVLVQAEKAKADKAATEAERKAHLAKYEKLLKEFQSRYSNHPYALNAALNLLLTHRTEAVRALVKARLEADPKKRKQKIQEGFRRFDKVLKDFQKLIKRYQAKIDEVVQKKMKELRAKEKDPFARDEIDEYYTTQYLARHNEQFFNLLRRRVMAEYFLGETALIFVRWQERLEEDYNSSKYLDLAFKAFRKIEEDYPDFESIYAKAGLGMAEVLMRQGKLAAATNKYDGLTLFRFSFQSPNPAEREQQKAYEKEIATEAVYGLASVWIRRKNYQNAIIVVDKMFERYPDALATYGGRMALLAKCEALTLKENPEPQKAMVEAFKVVEWSKKKEKPVAGRDFGRSALIAAVRMSEIRQKIKGPVEFPPEISLMIAIGFFETGKYDWAIYSYKDVLSSPNADEDDMVIAIKGLGNCYYNTKRYEEAAIAFSGVLERFPHRGSEAIKLARQALGILTKRFGKEDEAVRDFKKALQSRLGGASTFYNQGLEAKAEAEKFLEEKKKAKAIKRLEEAIESFKKVKKRDANGRVVAYYGDAQGAIGECMYLLGKLKGDIQLQRKAIQFLQEKLRQFERRNVRGWAACAYQLGRIYLEQGKYKKALEALLPFRDRLRSMKTYATAAKSLMIRCAIALGKNEIAEEEFLSLAKSEGENSAKTASAAYLLVDTYSRFVEREKAKIRNVANIHAVLYGRSNIAKLVTDKDLIYYVLQKNDKGVPRYRIAQSRAAKYAIYLYKYYKNKNMGDFSLYYWLGSITLEAKRYSDAIRILEDGVRMSPKVDKQASKEQVTAGQRYLFLAKRFLAEAYLGRGQRRKSLPDLKKAQKIFAELVSDNKFKRSIYLIYRAVEGLAVSSDWIAQLTKKKGDLAKAIEHYKKFQALLLDLVQRPYLYALVKKPEEPIAYVRYYEVTYRYFELLYQMGNYRDCYTMIKAYKDKGSDFGSPELKKKFLRLMEQAKRRSS